MSELRPTRRFLLKLFGATVAAASLPLEAGCASPSKDTASASISELNASFFTDAERRVLAVLVDDVFPLDDQPGASKLGAVFYIENFLTCLDGPTPKLWADGPFSNRNPFPDPHGKPSQQFPENDFAEFMALDRVSLAAWKLALYGSDAVGGGPNDAVLGKTPGLRNDFKRNLAKLSDSPSIDDFEDDFRDVFIDLVTQAAFCAPEYGGNAKLAGWKMAHFDGDSAPLGFSQLDPATNTFVERPEAPLSTANPGPDPDAMTFALELALGTATSFFNGKVFS